MMGIGFPELMVILIIIMIILYDIVMRNSQVPLDQVAPAEVLVLIAGLEYLDLLRLIVTP